MKKILIIVLFTISSLLLGENANNVSASEHINDQQVDNVQSINIRGKEIKVTPPKGYVPVKEIFPSIFTTFEQMTPPTNDLKEVYLPITVIEALSAGKELFYEEYASVQSWKEGEQYDMTQTMFAQIKQNYYKQFGIISAESIATYDSVLNEAESILKDSGITVPQVVPLGIYADTDNYIAFLQLIKYEMTQGNEKIVYFMLSSVTQMLLKGKTLNFYVFKKYKKREDIDYVKNFSERWAKNINILNKVNQQTLIKQYTNEKYGISFKYPQDWIINKLRGDYIFKITKGTGSKRKAFIVSATTENYESPDKFYEEMLNEVNAGSLALLKKVVGMEFVDSGSTEIVGNSAIYIIGHQKQLNICAVQKNIYLLRNNILFDFMIRASGKSIQEAELRLKDMEPVVDEILASLVFPSIRLDYPTRNISEQQSVDASFYMMIIISIFFTWGFGLLLPVLIRYVFVRKPIKKPIAITIAVIWFVVLLMLAILLQSTSKTHAALFLVSFVGYLIMHKGYKDNNEKVISVSNISDKKNQTGAIKQNSETIASEGNSRKNLHKIQVDDAITQVKDVEEKIQAKKQCETLNNRKAKVLNKKKNKTWQQIIKAPYVAYVRFLKRIDSKTGKEDKISDPIKDPQKGYAKEQDRERVPSEKVSSMGLSEELKKLAQLHASGVLSDEEFKKAKKRLLES